MKTKRIVTLMLTVVLTAFFTLQGISQTGQDDPPPPPPRPASEKMVKPHTPPPPPPPEMEQRAGAAAHIPDLTPDQEAAIKKERLNHTKNRTALINQIREKHAHLVSLLSSDDLNMNDVNKTIDQIGELQTKLLKENVTHDRNVRDLLTPVQKIIYDTHPKPYLKKGR